MGYLMVIYKKEQEQEKICTLIVFTIILDICIFIVNAVTLTIIGQTPIDTALVYGVYAGYFALTLPHFLRKLNKKMIVFFILLIIFIACSHLRNNSLFDMQTLLLSSYWEILIGIFMGSSVEDFGLLLNKFNKIARPIASSMVIVVYIYNNVLLTVWGSGAMGLSYMLLIVAILLMYKIYYKFNVIDCVLLVTILWTMFFQGSRGPMLSFFIYVLLLLIINLKNYKKKNIIILMSLVSLIVIVFANLYEIIEVLQVIIEKLGYRAKIFTWFVDGKLFNLNGRDSIEAEAMQLIEKNPIFGYGIFGERNIIGSYVHNLFFEITLDFGIVFGGFLIITIFCIFLFDFLKAEKNKRNVFIILISAYIVKLFMSGSFWTEFAFFMVLSISFLNSKSAYNQSGNT